MRVVRHPEVPQELEAAALWYEERQPGLGEDFLAEDQATPRRLVEAPERWRNIRGSNRKLLRSCVLGIRIGLVDLPVR